MAITGTANTCQILTNTPFVLSGLSQTNLATVNITDDNGLDVSECFGITSKIITVNGDNVTLTGDCNTSLEIRVTEGITNDIECLYTAYTQQQSGILLFDFSDGTTSDNVHPECCIALGFEPEIGPKQYFICRSIPEIDVTDCNNYSPKNSVDNKFKIFDFVTGGTVTTVPSAQCCYDYGFVDVTVGGQVKCIEYVEPNPCEDLEIVKPVPQFGDITFVNPSTGVETTLVPTAECCTSLGYSYAISGNKFKCFNAIAPPPTVTLTNDPCCLIVSTPTTTTKPIAVGGGYDMDIPHIICSSTSFITRYFKGRGTTPVVGDTFYTNSAGTTIFNGRNLGWQINGRVYQISSAGAVIRIQNCNLNI